MPFDSDYDLGLQMAQKFNAGANRNQTMYDRLASNLPPAAQRAFQENARVQNVSGKRMDIIGGMRDDYLDGVVARAGMSPEEKHQSMVDAAERAKAASRAETEAEDMARKARLKQEEQESWQRGQDYARDYYAKPRTGRNKYQEKFQETDAAGNPIGPLQSYDRRTYKVEAYTDPKTGETRHEVVPKGSPKGGARTSSISDPAYRDPRDGGEPYPADMTKRPVEETSIEEQKEVASQTVQGQANQPDAPNEKPKPGFERYGTGPEQEVGPDYPLENLQSKEFSGVPALGRRGLSPELKDELRNIEGMDDDPAKTLQEIDPVFPPVAEGDEQGPGYNPEDAVGTDVGGTPVEEAPAGAPPLSFAQRMEEMERLEGAKDALTDVTNWRGREDQIAAGAGAPDDLDATLAEAGVPPEETNIEELLGAVGATPEEIAGLTGQPPEDVRGDMPWTRPVADQPGDEPFPEDLYARVRGGHSKRTKEQWDQFDKHKRREEATHQQRRRNRAANARARIRAMTPAFQMMRFPNESDAAYAKRYAAGVQAMSGLQGAQLQSQTQLAGLGMQGETQIRIAKIQSDMQRAGLDMQRELQKAGLTQQDIQNKLNMLGQLPPHQVPDALNQIAGEIYGEGQAPSFTDKPTGAQLSNLGEQDFQNSMDQYYPNLDTMLSTASEGIFETNPDSEGHIGSTMGGIGPFENYDEKAQDFAYNLANLIKGNEINANNIAAVAEYLRRELQGGSQAFLQSQMGQEGSFGSDSALAGNRFFQAILSGKLPSMGDVQSIIDYGYN
tara:strand:- start:25473 stop:27824 length:2352 start_codon:yes stop_codon:yes gene_type:complete